MYPIAAQEDVSGISCSIRKRCRNFIFPFLDPDDSLVVIDRDLCFLGRLQKNIQQVDPLDAKIAFRRSPDHVPPAKNVALRRSDGHLGLAVALCTQRIMHAQPVHQAQAIARDSNCAAKRRGFGAEFIDAAGDVGGLLEA